MSWDRVKHKTDKQPLDSSHSIIFAEFVNISTDLENIFLRSDKKCNSMEKYLMHLRNAFAMNFIT